MADGDVRAPTMEDVRAAYGDADMSRKVHSERLAAAVVGREEGHRGNVLAPWAGAFEAGLHGVSLGVGVLLGARALRLGTRASGDLVLAAAPALGVAMGLSTLVARAVECTEVAHERAREKWEFDNYPEGEVEEMVQIYVAKKGFSRDDAALIMRTYTGKPEYHAAFIDHMCCEELGHSHDGSTWNVESIAANSLCLSVGAAVPAVGVAMGLLLDPKRESSHTLAGTVAAVAVGTALGAARGAASVELAPQGAIAGALTVLCTALPAYLARFAVPEGSVQ